MTQQDMAATNGSLERLGGGRAADVFAWTPGVVLKLVREERFEPALEREAAGLEAAAAAGLSVPRPLGFVTHDGRLGLLLEHVDGRDGFSLIEARPWRTWTLSRLIGRLHVDVGEATAPASMMNLKERARETIETSVHVPAKARPRLRALLDSLPDGDRLCHMDFHPGNVMLTSECPYIIDFPNALRGPAIADHAKSWVILRAGKAPPGQGRIVRVLISLLRRVALAGYEHGYRSAADINESELARWKAIQVAMRLDEANPAERTGLLRLLSRSLRAAEVLKPTGP